MQDPVLVKIVEFIKKMSLQHSDFVGGYKDLFFSFTNGKRRYENCSDLANVSFNMYLICQDRIILFAKKIDPEIPNYSILEMISDNWTFDNGTS